MRKLTVLAAALVLGCPASLLAQQAADWVQVFAHEAGLVSLDRSSVMRDGNHISATSRIRFQEPREDGVAYVLSSFRYDCSARTADLLGFTQHRADGSMVNRTEVPQARRRAQPVSANSPNDAILGSICR